MKGDREKCIEAGAWDYLSKPVDTEQMLSVLRVVAASLRTCDESIRPWQFDPSAACSAPIDRD